MKVIIFMAWLLALINCLSGCVSQKTFHEPVKTTAGQVVPEFSSQVSQTDLTISLRLADNNASLNADLFKPSRLLNPTTLVIMVPGSGNISRRGESNTDGINTFNHFIDTNYLWAQALASQGLMVLSYDKRTCNAKTNPLCQTNWHKDIDEEGIKALANDLDQVCQYASRIGGRIVLLSSTQGAQVISLSQCLKDAKAIILMSPIIGELDKMWINGLNHAVTTTPHEKNQLINRKESTEAFFNSLKRGDFPNSANIKGASVKFWQSWIEASPKTLPRIIDSKKPSLLLFSSKDSFSPLSLITQAKNGIKNSSSRLRIVDDSDRNLANELGVSAMALKEISKFIKDLP
jgi:hypothetical protein